MHNRPGYTVDPVYEDSSTGQQIVDVQVRQTGHSSAVGRDGVYRNWENDYTADSQGRFIYDPKDGLDELAESPVVGFNEEEYVSALFESNPVIEPALEWAGDNLPQEFQDAYNAAVDGGNLNKIHELLDIMIEQYMQFNPQEAAETPTDEVSETDEVEMAKVVETLQNSEAEGTETAYQWLESAEQWKDTDPCVSDICQATAGFHRGEFTAEEAISMVLDNYPMAKAVKAYKQLFN